MIRVANALYRDCRKALSVKLLHSRSRSAVRFDDENLVPCAGLFR